MELCDRNYNFGASYIEISISVILIIFLQIALFVHVIKNKHKQKHKWMTITFIAMQLCGLCFTLIDFIRYSIDPYFKVIQNNLFLCSLFAYSPKAIPIIYFLCYLSHILLRLITSFNGSCLAISKKTIFLLVTFIFLPIPFMIFVYTNIEEAACKWQWNPIDVNETFLFCDWHMSGRTNNIILAMIAWVVLLNLLFCAMFGAKLRNILNRRVRSDGAQQKNVLNLKKLSVKNMILTVVVTISSMTCWLMWIVGAAYTPFGISFLYFDLWFNCFIIALMYGHNEMYFDKLCWICVYCWEKGGAKRDSYVMLNKVQGTQKYGTTTQMTDH